MPNLDLVRKDDISSFRKIALGTWETTYDPSVYGTMELRAENALKYLAEFREKTGKKITISHLMARAAAEMLAKTPDANALLRWGRIYQRRNVGVFFQVVMTDEGADKADLSGATLYEVDKKSVEQIHDEFTAKVGAVRARKDPALEKTRSTFLSLPYFAVGFVLKVISFLTYTLNLDLSKLGIPKDPFGSIMITNVGSLGLDVAYPPLVPYSRVPILLAVGAIKDEPVVDNGAVCVGKVLRVHATFDHRFIDGFHAAAMSKTLRAWIENPYEHFDDLSKKS